MLNNKTIYDAMTIKLTAEDIPMEIPKLDPVSYTHLLCYKTGSSYKNC